MMILSSTSLRAQTAVAPAPHRFAIGISGDVGSVADAFVSGCGDNEASYGYGGSFLYRPAGWLILEGSMHRAKVIGNYGCDLLLRVYQIGPNQYETRDTSFTAPHVPLTEVFLRAGVETPPTMPLFRASLGVGHIWHSSLPVGSVAVGMGTRGAGLRFYGELETFVSRLHALEHHHPFQQGTGGLGPTVDDYYVPLTLHPGWTTLHLGIEVPLNKHSL